MEFVQRDEHGVPQFSKRDIVTLNTIYRLKATGMPLQEIKHYLHLIDEGLDSVSERKQIMEKQKAKIEEQIDDWKKALITIDGKVNYYRAAEKEHSLGVCHDERDEFIKRLMAGELK